MERRYRNSDVILANWLEAAGFEAQLPECRPEHPCLREDSPLRVYAEEARPRVISSGARLCVSGLVPAEHEIALLEVEPIGTAAFRFRFSGSAPALAEPR